MTYIYALVDPRDHRVRYVGKSDNPEKRLRIHLKTYEKNRNGLFKGWFRQLVAAGTKPQLRILLAVPKGSSADDFERHWIWAFRWAGEKLTNIHEGGTGGATRTGQTDSLAHRAAISKAQKGRICSEETLVKMRLVAKGRIPWNKGKQLGPLSPDTKAKLSVAQQRRRALETKEQREVTAAKLRQLWTQPEYRERILAKVTGQKRSPYKYKKGGQ